MKIGQLAQQAGVGIDTVRYYEREGLLPAPVRLASGYRAYRSADVERLRFVRRAKALGFSLAQVRDLLAISDDRASDMGPLKRVAEARLADVELRLQELGRIRDGLRALVDRCPGEGELRWCPILHALVAEETP
jgi:MerR family copper efflux transcriptional regulator